MAGGLATMCPQQPHPVSCASELVETLMPTKPEPCSSSTQPSNLPCNSCDTESLSATDADQSESSTTSHDDSATSRHGRSSIRVITFDLDNTLWCTMSTIGAAIQAVDKFWATHKIQPAVRTEVIMKELFAADKKKYAPLLGDNATCPCRFTQLRLDAMHHLLTAHHNLASTEAHGLAQQALDVMTEARHAAIPQHLAVDVVETLQAIRNLLSRNDNNDHHDEHHHHPLLIGAITDGNAHPAKVAALAPYFDFCIHAETVGVSKPDGRVFAHAVQHVREILLRGDNVDDDFDATWTADDLVAGWVHVGDDCVKDIVGAKRAGMRTIWCRELIQSSGADMLATAVKKDLSSWSTDSACQEKKPNDVDSHDNASYADAVVDHFADIVRILEAWKSKDVSRNYNCLPNKF